MLTKRSSREWLRVTALLVVFLSGALFPPSSPLRGALAPSVRADSTPQTLPLNQNWSNTGMITTDDNWAGVPGIVGFRGDDLTTVTGTDPQTILADGSGTPVDVIANQANPNTQATGGVAEFDGIANPVVALQGSGTADAPHIVINVNTTGLSGVRVFYNLRDIDGSADNAIQPVALQYRVGASGNYTNLPAGFVADATSGPSLATLVTPVTVALPAATDNQPLVQLRIMTTNAVGNDEWVGIDDIQVFVPSEAKLDSFTVTPVTGGKVLLEWRTGLEVDNLGFNVYREVNGKRTRVNPQMLAGSALMVGEGTRLKSGYAYAWADSAPSSADARYWLEAVDLNGQSMLFGPVAVDRSRARDRLPPESGRVLLLSNVGNTGNQSGAVARAVGAPEITAARLTAQSDITARPAVKLSVNQEGWYRVTQPELVAAGFAATTDPRQLQLFAEGQEQAIIVRGEDDGRFDAQDAIEFYGLRLDTPSTNVRTYWLVAGSQSGLRIERDKKKGSRAAAGSFPYTVERRDRTVYFPALRNGDTENFFGAVIARNVVDQSLTVTHMDTASTDDVTLEVTLQGVTALPHRVDVKFNGSDLGEINFASVQQGIAKFIVPRTAIKEGQNTVTLASLSSDTDVSIVDTLRLTYPHAYTADGDALRFTASSKQRVTIDGFSNASIRVVDVTDPSAPRELRASVEAREKDYAVTVSVPKGGARTLLAFADNRVKQVARIVASQPSTLRDKSQAADLVIIARKDFFPVIEPLRALRQSEGLSVNVVDIEDIYNEFNFGEKSPQAVKDFLAYAQSQWSKAPRFALFAGDASADPKNYLGFGDSDIVPTKLVDTIVMETASDEWLADFDGDGLAEMALGRLPARTADELSQMVAKIVNYDSATVPDGVLLVSDSNDGIDFERGSAQLHAMVPDNISIEEIVRGRQDDTATKNQVLASVSRGQRLVNYFGHGNIDQWRGNILTSSEAREQMSSNNLSLFLMITCLNGYFQDAALESLAESVIKSPRSGAVAVWASSGMCEADGQGMMNVEMFRLIFNRNNANSEHLTLGEAARQAKTVVTDLDIRRSYVLFGDPTMRLR